MKWYSTSEASEALNISSTRVRQLIKKHQSNKQLVRFKNVGKRKSYSVSDMFLDTCRKSNQNFKNKVWSGEDLGEEVIIETFTPEEHKKFETVIKQHSELSNELNNLIPKYNAIKKDLEEIEARFKDHITDLRNERNYLRKSLDNQQEQFSKLLQAVQQRNLIEATEKGLKND